MTLAALISAYHEADAPLGELRSTLPLAGRTLVERQVRVAAAAGASPIVLLVERLPPQILAAIDRLRAEQIQVVAARSVAEAADAVHHDDRLLFIADGLVPDQAHVARLIGAGGPALLTVPDFVSAPQSAERFERIDAESRWAGLALLDGRLLKATAAMLGDWDLQSTLLRRAVQAGARQFSLGGGAQVVLALRAEELADVQAQIVEHSGEAGEDWVSHYLLAPAEEAATRLLMPTAATSEWLCMGTIGLSALAAFCFGSGWLLPGLFLLLLATPLPGISERLALLRMQSGGTPRWWSRLVPASAGMALLALGYGLGLSRGWGCIVLAATTIAFAVALRAETRDHPQPIPGRMFLADWKGMGWAMLPFAVTGLWTAGLVGIAGYAAASFFWVQRAVHRPKSAAPKD